MPDTAVIHYVRAAASLLDLRLDDAQAERVAMHLARTRAMAALLQQVPLTPQDEPAEIFRPAPFPEEDPV
ncbi:MAG TPA: DUF4089 domain-containing protein [Albitalea sp.]|nr:DUF4089 domain-containing protein [Albitalea sp.]